MPKFRGLTALGVIAIAGCNLSSDLPSSQRVGLMNVTQLTGGDTATLTASATFFQTGTNITYGIPNTAIVGDTCTVADYNGPEEIPPVKYDNLNAGPSIAVSSDKDEATMLPSATPVGSIFYSLMDGPMAFTPGSDFNIEIPGDTGGFPAQTLKVKTLVAPTFAPIERHPSEDLHLSWSPAGNLSGAVQLEFLFSSDSNLTPNKSMTCALRDDGTQDIPKYVYGDWAASPDDAQSVSGFRWITNIQQQNDVLMDVIVQVMLNPVTFAVDEGAASDIRASARR